MIQQQIAQFLFWLGVIATLPALYRFVYVGSSYIWRRIFPTNKIVIQLLNEDRDVMKTVTVRLDKNRSKKVVDIIDEALQKNDKAGK